jgi:hypothetical protein
MIFFFLDGCRKMLHDDPEVWQRAVEQVTTGHFSRAPGMGLIAPTVR